MPVDLRTRAALRDAVELARAAAEADGSLRPDRGEHFEPTPAFRNAIQKLIEDGTYRAAVAEVIAADPDLG